MRRHRSPPADRCRLLGRLGCRRLRRGDPVDLDAAHLRLGLHRQRKADLQNAIGERGLHVLQLDAFGERNGAEEAAVLPLASVEIVLLLFRFGPALARDAIRGQKRQALGDQPYAAAGLDDDGDPLVTTMVASPSSTMTTMRPAATCHATRWRPAPHPRPDGSEEFCPPLGCISRDRSHGDAQGPVTRGLQGARSAMAAGTLVAFETGASSARPTVHAPAHDALKRGDYVYRHSDRHRRPVEKCGTAAARVGS